VATNRASCSAKVCQISGLSDDLSTGVPYVRVLRAAAPAPSVPSFAGNSKAVQRVDVEVTIVSAAQKMS